LGERLSISPYMYDAPRRDDFLSGMVGTENSRVFVRIQNR
jgi:hypothetical protein